MSNTDSEHLEESYPLRYSQDLRFSQHSYLSCLGGQIEEKGNRKLLRREFCRFGYLEGSIIQCGLVLVQML
jgi:hypothetical protein